MKIINKEEIIRFSYSLVILLLSVCLILSLVSSHENDNNIFNQSSVFGFLAITLAAVNIFGGFLVTQRMLAMYKKKKK